MLSPSLRPRPRPPPPPPPPAPRQQIDHASEQEKKIMNAFAAASKSPSKRKATTPVKRKQQPSTTPAKKPRKVLDQKEVEVDKKTKIDKKPKNTPITKKLVRIKKIFGFR